MTPPTPGKAAGRKARREADLQSLEQLLLTSFHPIEPRPAFRRGLHTRLERSAAPARSPGVILEYVVISLGGVAAAALLLVAAVQAAAALLTSLGLLHKMRRPAEER